jgi:hypothetical protein
VGQFSYHDHPQRLDFPDFEESVSSLTRILDESYQSVEGNDLDTLYLPFWRSAYHYCRSRCMFTGVGSNSNRLIGIVPLAARPGDRICILLGCDHVMILRPSAPLSTSRLANMDTFLVVGQTYCDGFMDGEALIGPFALGTRKVSRWDESTGRSQLCYHNTKTGLWQEEDPRLKDVPLPIHWERQRHDQEGFCIRFMNTETGEKDRIHDPRLTAEELRGRGVGLQGFTLV